jgi:hypothetical protein
MLIWLVGCYNACCVSRQSGRPLNSHARQHTHYFPFKAFVSALNMQPVDGDSWCKQQEGARCVCALIRLVLMHTLIREYLRFDSSEIQFVFMLWGQMGFEARLIYNIYNGGIIYKPYTVHSALDPFICSP